MAEVIAHRRMRPRETCCIGFGLSPTGSRSFRRARGQGVGGLSGAGTQQLRVGRGCQSPRLRAPRHARFS
eukprot:700296-Hanusia_phi.AAC.1